jgi:succinate dehydrogenase hydrophobic anchor subunit
MAVRPVGRLQVTFTVATEALPFVRIVQEKAAAILSAQIFISYASKDQRVAQTLCTALEARAFKCWIASRDIDPGESFMEAIVRAIRGARVMLLVFSSAANRSEEVKREIVLAGLNKLVVIPVRVEDVTPNDAFAYQFATRQWVDLFEDWEEQVERLTSSIAATLQVAPTGTVLSRVPSARPWWINITAPMVCVGTVLLTWWLTAVSLGPGRFQSVSWLTDTIVGLVILGCYAVALSAQSLNTVRRIIYFRRRVSSPSFIQNQWYEDLTAFATTPITLVMTIIIVTIPYRSHATFFHVIGSPFVGITVLLFMVCAVTQALVHMSNVIDGFFQRSRYVAKLANALVMVAMFVTSAFAILRIMLGGG